MDPSGETPDQPSVLGSLPRTRPGVRSPRREAAGKSPRPAASAKQQAAERHAAEPTSTRARAADPVGPSAGRSGTEEIEALTKAGISVAAGAASIGLKLAGRTAGALRNAIGGEDRET